MKFSTIKSDVIACNSLCPYTSTIAHPVSLVSIFHKKKIFRKGLKNFPGIKIEPIREGNRRPIMALTCLCAMTSSSSPQTVCRARSKSGEIPPEGLIHSRGPRCSALIQTRVSRQLPKTFRPSQLVLEIGLGAANDTRHRPTNVTGSGVCNWSRSVSQMPLVS